MTSQDRHPWLQTTFDLFKFLLDSDKLLTKTIASDTYCISARGQFDTYSCRAAPQPTAIGSMPAPMASVVMMTGRATMAHSTSKIEFLVAMPISMISPISDGIEELMPVASNATNVPPSDIDSASRIPSVAASAASQFHYFHVRLAAVRVGRLGARSCQR